MALLKYMLGVVVALSLATVATSEDLEAAQRVTGPLPWEQSLHYMEEYYGYVTPQDHEVAPVNHKIVEDTFQTAFMQVGKKSSAKRKQSTNSGKKKKLTKKLKSTQNKKEAYESMFKLITDPEQKCELKKDCKPGNVCCWIPGNDISEQHCVKMVPRLSYFYQDPEPMRVYKRKTMLDDVRSEISQFHKYSPNSLEVLVLPVGQGDCVAMYCPNSNTNKNKHLVMFDCGSKNRQEAFNEMELRDAILENVMNVTIFISHGDVDHYKYLPLLFPAGKGIDRVIIGGERGDYAGIEWWINDNGEKLYTINGGEECIGDCKLKKWNDAVGSINTDMNICGTEDIEFDIIAANVGPQKNQKSIVLKVTAKGGTAGNWSLLLSGDMEGEAANDIAEKVPHRLKSNVYQISHHGACDQANECPWLQAIQPNEAFVSHPYIGQFGHPRCNAIINLLSLGTIITGNELNPLTHNFTCVKDNKTPYTARSCHHIFGTYPEAHTICTVRFTMGKPPVTYYKCYSLGKRPREPPSEDSGDERPSTRRRVETGDSEDEG